MEPSLVVAAFSALSALTSAAAMFWWLSRMLATGRLYTGPQVVELREDRNRWRDTAETILPAVQDSTTATTEVAGLVRSLDLRVERMDARRARREGA